jgi:hypothetical protein
LYGAGLNFFSTTEGYTQFVPYTGKKEYLLREDFNVGIGVDIKLKYAINNNLFLFAGCILTYDFLSDVVLEARPSNPALYASGEARDFSMFGVRPYISFGFRL